MFRSVHTSEEGNQFSVLSSLGMGGGSIGDMLTMYFVIFKGMVSIPALVLEMVLRPQFGSRYFFVTTPILTWFLLSLWGLATMLFGLLPGHGRLAVFDIGTLGTAFDIGCLIHVYRVHRRMMNMDLEFDSEYEGPALPIFRLLPGHDRWTRVRIVYEPATALIATITLYTFHIIGTSAMLFLLFSTFCLVSKTIILWYEGWLYLRILRDTKARAGIMADIAAGKPIPDTVGSTVLAGIPKDITPETRSAIAQTLTGLTPELDALVTPVGNGNGTA